MTLCVPIPECILDQQEKLKKKNFTDPSVSRDCEVVKPLREENTVRLYLLAFHRHLT